MRILNIENKNYINSMNIENYCAKPFWHPMGVNRGIGETWFAYFNTNLFDIEIAKNLCPSPVCGLRA
jgi:hypothetical protein